MAQLSTKIKLYAAANGVASVDFMKDVMLQDDSDGKGAYIKEWNLDIAKPTDTQLASYETAATTTEANNVVISTEKQLMVLGISTRESMMMELTVGKQIAQ